MVIHEDLREIYNRKKLNVKSGRCQMLKEAKMNIA